MSELTVVILAAGKGKRMRSSLPKVLHAIAGKPMLSHVVDTARTLKPARVIVVYGHGGEQVKDTLPDADLQWTEQAEQLGTGHAVDQAMPLTPNDDVVLVLYGDVPLTRAETLQPLVDAARGGALAVLTAELTDPTGYGRIIRRDDGLVARIVEEKDASDDEKQVREINTGLLALPAKHLKRWLGNLGNDNAQGEYYLTDIIAMADGEGVPVRASVVADPDEVAGVNSKPQLAALERAYQRRLAQQHLVDGLHLMDPARFDVRGTLSHGEDCVVDVNVVFEGEVTLGNGVTIDANCVLKNVTIGDGTHIKAFSHLEDCDIAADCTIGPYARLRPGTVMDRGAKVGNFVEVKKSRVGEGSKVNHLTYIGDTEIGRGVNVGAGTVTCNYDGANKAKTVLEDGVFIGSGSMLVAPLRIGKGATVGAGSTLTRDVPADTLALARARQVVIKEWTRPVKDDS